MGYYDRYSWAPYVPVAVRRRQAEREAARLGKRGRVLSPVIIEGRQIAATFWGRSWCENLERYSDFSNRLPRGRTYVRNGSVMDLQIGEGRIESMVSGSTIYEIEIKIKPLAPARWKAVRRSCSGRIESVVELLQGRFSDGVMQVLVDPRAGLFPEPREMSFRCSCPDDATICKHIAATIYGVGARLDTEPTLFFKLRQVSEMDLIADASSGAVLKSASRGRKKDEVPASELSNVFSIDVVTADRPIARRLRRRSPPPEEPRGFIGDTLTSKDLLALGIPNGIVGNWLVEGILVRTDRRGVYRTTAMTDAKFGEYEVQQGLASEGALEARAGDLLRSGSPMESRSRARRS